MRARFFAWRRSRVAWPVVGLSVMLIYSFTLSTVLAAITPTTVATDLATALTSNPAFVTGASFVTVPGGTPNAVADTPLSGFPTNGTTYTILTNGNATVANQAQSALADSNLGGGSIRGTTDFDVTILKIDLNVPVSANCLSFDFKFLSEEFPQYVGSTFNDAFIAELDTSNWSTGASTITAPNNFAFDPGGNVISINAGGATSLTAANATGTIYGGATALLKATTPITSGAHSIYLSIFDQADNTLDSAVFVDNLNLFTASGVCTAGSTAATATTTALGSAPNPSNTGQNVTFTATVSSASATGTVTFMDGATTLGTGTLSGGIATYSTTALSSGTHSVTAVYAGDNLFSGSTSTAVSQVVNAVLTSTTTSLVATPASPVTIGQSVTLTATVSSAAATGSVTFKDNGTTLGIPVAVSNGVATYVATGLAVGSHSFTAVYSGDSTYATSTSTAIAYTVNSNPATHFTVTSASYTTNNHTTYNFTVTALGSTNAVDTGYLGIVHFTSSDTAAALPANYTFVAGDNGVHSFSVTFHGAGMQTVTATDTTTSSITGTSSSITVGALVYYPLPKSIRVVDTRVGAAALYNGSNGNVKFADNSTKTYTLTNVTYGGYTIPAGAQALAANIAAVGTSGIGFLTAYPGPADPTGANRPVASNINYPALSTVSNASSLTLGADGTLNVYSRMATDMLIDVSGYYAPAGTADPNAFSSGLVYYPLPKPIRLVDTRVGAAALYNGSNGNVKFTDNSTKTYTMTNVTYGGYTIPAGAKALATNIAVIGSSGTGFLTAYPGPADPTGASRPLVSNINYTGLSNISNASSLTLGTGGIVNVYSRVATDLLIDVSGYYAPAGTVDPNTFSSGLTYYPLAKPIRVVDTRVGAAALYNGSNGNVKFTADSTKTYTLTNVTYRGYTIPTGAQALATNIAVAGSAGTGFITAYPGPADPTGASRPLVSIINYTALSTVSNASSLTLGTGGTVNVYSRAATDLIIDLSGYFAPSNVVA